VTDIPSMLSRRTENVAAVVGDNIYCIGGFDARGGVMTEVEQYSISRRSWSLVAPLPEPRHHVMVVTYEDREIYIIGGFSSILFDAVSTVFIYDAFNNVWTSGPRMPTARGAGTAQIWNGRIFCIGGQARSEEQDTVEVFDIAEGSWRSLSPMPTPREHLTSAIIGNVIYVVAGRLIQVTSGINVHEGYDVTTDTWTTLASMPSKRGGLVAAGLGGSMFVFGGEGEETFENNEEYLPELDQWVCRQPMPTARHGLGASVHDGGIYLVGGGPEPNAHYSNITEIYYPESFGGPASECSREGPL